MTVFTESSFAQLREVRVAGILRAAGGTEGGGSENLAVEWSAR